jgi:hypothetical protein
VATAVNYLNSMFLLLYMKPIPAIIYQDFYRATEEVTDGLFAACITPRSNEIFDMVSDHHPLPEGSYARLQEFLGFESDQWHGFQEFVGIIGYNLLSYERAKRTYEVRRDGSAQVLRGVARTVLSADTPDEAIDRCSCLSILSFGESLMEGAAQAELLGRKFGPDSEQVKSLRKSRIEYLNNHLDDVCEP